MACPAGDRRMTGGWPWLSKKGGLSGFPGSFPALTVLVDSAFYICSRYCLEALKSNVHKGHCLRTSSCIAGYILFSNLVYTNWIHKKHVTEKTAKCAFSKADSNLQGDFINLTFFPVKTPLASFLQNTNTHSDGYYYQLDRIWNHQRDRPLNLREFLYWINLSGKNHPNSGSTVPSMVWDLT